MPYFTASSPIRAFDFSQLYEASPSPATALARPQYQPRGAAAEYFQATDKEVLLAGPAGTGKTRAALERFHSLALAYTGARGLLLRKTLASLSASALVTFREQVHPTLDGVVFHGARADRPAQYEYPNGSVLVIGGLDRPEKVMSTDYDWVHIVEATELTESEVMMVTTRLRAGGLPFQQLSMDCNPGAPNHWLKLRGAAGLLRILESRHEDNPRLWDAEARGWTPFGLGYLDTLDRLTGVLKDRLRYGRWVAAEGMIYDTWDARVHLVTEEDLIAWGVLTPEGTPNRSAIRSVWAGVDFGFTNPGCIGVWLEDGDGRLYRVAEVYQTQRQVDPWWLAVAEALEARYGPVEAWICDPSEPAYIAAFREHGLNAVPADNDVGPGIQAVQKRLAPAGDGFPRLFLCRADPAAADPSLVERHLPTCTEREIEAYVWDTAGGLRAKGEKPVKVNDHGVDQMRYVVVERDGVGGGRQNYDSF